MLSPCAKRRRLEHYRPCPHGSCRHLRGADRDLPRKRWQRDHNLQARIVVLQPDLAAMKPRDRRNEAEAETASRRVAARLEAHETLKHMAALFRRNARAVIGDRKQHL